MIKIDLYHTNDIHSNFSAFASVSQVLKSLRSQDDIVLDAGDFNDFKDIMVTGTFGLGGMRLLELAGYDGLCVGNNEGFSALDAIMTMGGTTVPLLSANLVKLDGSPIPNLKPSILIERKGIRFLIIGVSPYFGYGKEDVFNTFFAMGGIRSQNPYPIIQAQLEQQKGLYDISILLSHLGHQYDIETAQKVEGIDIIVGGHSHTLSHVPERIGKTWIHHAGDYGKNVGKLSLMIDDGKLTCCNGEMIPVTGPSDPRILEEIEIQTVIARKELGKPFVTIPEFDFSLFHENTLVNFICDALKKEYPCDFSLMNHGIVNGPLQGEISELSLLECSPSPLNPTRIKLSGKQILQALEQSFDDKHCMDPGRGAGFRGSAVGALSFSHNVRYQKSPMKIWIDHEEIQPDKIYDVMTHDYLQRGSGYPSLQTPDETAIFYDGYIRDLLKRHLADEDLYHMARILRLTK
jgi:2',3'-cyclic-nucleotide 2'-phosphodiesterase (5'-nucleotidase family)